MTQQTEAVLSEKTIQTVKATVPLLQERGLEITKRFYQIMFSQHPELLNVFNQTNQKIGRQQQALASAVYAAAANIDQLEVIIPVVKQIGQKHRSLGVKAEHYPIVGQCLLQAIKEVANAPQDVLDAWGEAYGVIATAFIQIEADMYKQAEELQGGWKDLRKFVVSKKVKESDVITSFYLQPQDGKEISTFIPGQYITVQVKINGEKYLHNRQYSLSDAPGKGYYRISVKREDPSDAKPAGVVSNYLHDHVQEGSVLEISAPAGEFVLQNTNRPVVLLSGGVGVTPLMSMLHTLASQQRNIYFIHAAQNSNVRAFQNEVTDIVKQYPQVEAFTCYSAPTEADKLVKNYDKEGYIELEWLQSILPDVEADYYFCGPLPYMKSIKRILAEMGVKDEFIHYEFFGPAADLA